MRMRKVTAIDVCEVTGYTRNQLRGLFNELPPYSTQHAEPRVAREFTAHDLIVLSAIHDLEVRYGMRRSAIVALSELLGTALSGPKNINQHARLLVLLSPPSVTYVDVDTQVHEGILLPLGPVFDRVDRYLTFDVSSSEVRQSALKLGPTIIANPKKRRNG